MNGNEKIDLSVVVLCYQSGETIREFVSQLREEAGKLGIVYELILVANYSKDIKDETPAIVSELAKLYSDVQVVSRSKAGKMGWDMRSGLEVSTGKFIAVIDGDGQMPASDIPTVYRIISSGNFDLVKTFRAKRFDGIYRRVLSKIYNIIFELLYRPKSPVTDVNSKPKIMTRNALDSMQLTSNDWFTDAEIMIEANRLQLRVCEIATVFYQNERRSSFVSFGTIFEFIYNLIYYKFKSSGK